MILSVQRQAGLSDDFFFDNALESINHCPKVSIRNKKATFNPKGARDLNCTMAEAGRIYHNMLEQTWRNIHRAIIGLGSYRLVPEFADHTISPTSWNKLNEKHPKYNSATSSATLTASKKLCTDEDLTDSPTELNRQRSGGKSANCSVCYGEPAHYTCKCREQIFSWRIWEGQPSGNIQRLTGQCRKKSSPAKVLARHLVFQTLKLVVVSTSSAEFHHVSLDNKSCPTKCDCTRFKKLCLCALCWLWATKKYVWNMS